MIGEKEEGKEISCSYCYNKYQKSEMKVCGKCWKRRYCSKECQKKDWSDGQCHRYWCGKSGYGESGIDWRIVPISEEKGLGMIALREMPVNYRVLIERPFQYEEFVRLPAAEDLLPTNSTLLEKFQLNSITCEMEERTEPMIFMNMSRINHSCDPSCSHEDIQITGKHMKILLTNRLIAAGEEITYSYTDLGDPVASRCLLQKKWNIHCSSENCFCYLPSNYYPLMKQLDEEIWIECKQGDVGKGLEKVGKLLFLCDQYCPAKKRRTLFDGFQIAVMKSETVSEGLRFLQLGYDLTVEIATKDCEAAKIFKSFLNNPESHPNYLIYG
jgi:hypothetical protein